MGLYVEEESRRTRLCEIGNVVARSRCIDLRDLGTNGWAARHHLDCAKPFDQESFIRCKRTIPGQTCIH